jgi:PPM family protein phosphatase
MIKFVSSSVSEVGLKRTNNEDAYLDLPGLGLFAVSDGMGGAAAGEIASRIFIDTVSEFFSNDIQRSEKEIYELVQNIFSHSNKRIIDFAFNNPDCAGMGCTADVLVFSGERFVVGHVGDSRIYIFRNGDLLQLTKDHSFVQQQVDNGIITPQEARKHVRKNVLLRALGTNQTLSFDMMRGRSFRQDLFLLCSDGLTDMVEDAKIKDVLASNKNLSDKATKLMQLANAGGGRDNITVVICQVLES